MKRWKQSPIRELVEPVETWDPSRANPGGSFNYIDLSAIDQGTKTITLPRGVACVDAPSRARQLVKAGDVLVSTVRPNLNGVARLQEELHGATASTGFCVLRSNLEVLEGRYLFQWVKTPAFIDNMTRRATGQSYPAVSDRIVGESLIPLPPLPEQRRIADILDRAEALRAKRRAALALLDTFTQSIFLDMFVEGKRYQNEALDAVCELITDGTHYTPAYCDEGGVIFLSSKNVTSGYVDWTNIKHIPESLHAELHRRVAPKRNDVLLAKNGTTGIAAIVDRDCIFDIYVSLALLRPAARLLPIYLQSAVNSPACTRQFNASLKGIGVPNLHLKEIRGTKIPIPPLPLQQEFARRVAAVERMRASQRSALAKLDEFFASLQHRAFRGEL